MFLLMKKFIRTDELQYSDCSKKEPASQARDQDAAKRLWKISEQLVDLKYNQIDSEISEMNNDE